MERTQDSHRSTMEKILRTASKNELVKEDRFYAENQLRKIYSQELSRIMNEKKYSLMFDKNREEIESSLESTMSRKIESINRLQEKSLERKEKIIKDRLKTYKMNDKQWVLKTEFIKDKIRREEQSMLQTAEQYRVRSETQWKERQTEQTNRMKDFSSKYHTLFNSKLYTERSHQSHQQNQLFNRSKLQDLMRKRKSQFKNHRKAKTIQNEIKNHQKREHFLTQSKSKEQLDKLMNKLEKMQKIQIKKEEKHRTESIQRAKMKLHQKIYKNSKPEIGVSCEKYELKESKFRVKTVDNRHSASRFKSSPLQGSNIRFNFSMDEPLKNKNQKNWEQYCKKSRRIKIERLLKTSVRTALNSQFKSSHFKSQFSQC